MNQTLTIIFSFVFPCLMTTLGALLVFFFNKPSKTLNIITIGLASGIMLSASIWSLLLPAFENAEQDWQNLSFIPVTIGFVLGGIFMIFLDFLSTKFFKSNQDNQKPFKLFTAITIHNIPEGMAVGFSVGTAVALQNAYIGAFMFTLGIALQNFPEGLATALPIHNCLKNRKKAFFLSTLSGIVEPVFALAGFFLASYITCLMPWLLAFSAGAMIYVIIQELMPELHNEKSSLGTWAFIVGFVLMMLLDVCL
ncbi:MAG: ZIP family metal transporter [Candidatus Caccovivens sp.]